MILRSSAVFFRTAWSVIRSLSTDDAYDNYLAHHAEAHGDVPALTRREFYMRQQQEKWTGVSRCC